MKRFFYILSLLAISCLFWFACDNEESREVKIKILQTTDIHGNYFPYDFIEDKPGTGSLSRIYTYVKNEREKLGNNLLLFDNGDILQGQPTAYYYNFIDTITPHLTARILNYMGYEAATVGNHDIEAGPDVYNRVVRQSDFPWMAANALRKDSGDPYFKPYSVFEIEGVTIAVLGMITPAIPAWLPEELWWDMSFENISETAEKWLPIIKEEENPDVIIGLLHLGINSHIITESLDEGGGRDLAVNFPDFDILMLGHDHKPVNEKVLNNRKDSVLIINPGANGNWLSEVELTIKKKGDKLLGKTIAGNLVDVNIYEPDSVFLNYFRQDFDTVKSFVSEKVTSLTKSISSRDAFFGLSAFADLIHNIQLDLTEADVSFTAPLSFDTEIVKGDIRVSDMFKLYKYENFLYVMTLSGQEIKDFLEFSYTLWTNQMKSEGDHLLLVKQNPQSERDQFVNPYYNFDSAAGISYTVDVTKPQGEKIRIDSKMMNGKYFIPDSLYKVAINSYRGNGGGGHLSEGAKIPREELSSRIEYSTSLDLRYYLMQWMKTHKSVNPNIISNWKFIPEAWTVPAAKKDYQLLFTP